MIHFNLIKNILATFKNGTNLGSVLFLLNSVLLSIWATKHTLALRNILLVVGTLISIAIIRRELLSGDLRKIIMLRHSIPLIFIGLMFIWVFWHASFMPSYPDIKIAELKSTWLRSFLAVINGIAIGLLVRRNVFRLNWLWIGILASFIVLYFQYIPRVFETFRLFQYDPYGYIFHVKINAVLVGSILIAGLGGLTLDLMRLLSPKEYKLQISLCIFTLFIILFAFVYIFDSRNGIVIAAFLFSLWGFLFFKKFILNIRFQNNIFAILKPMAAIFLLLLTFAFFLIQQNTYNSGWSNFSEDFLIGLQSSKYINWHDFDNLGMPITPEGRKISSSTYERTALIVEGVKIIYAYPLGCGFLTQPFKTMLPYMYPGVVFGELATHSAWVDIGIAYGTPGLVFLIGGLIIAAFNSIKDRAASVANITTLSLILCIFIIYLVGEVATQHGIEILFYFLGLIFILQIPKRNSC